MTRKNGRKMKNRRRAAKRGGKFEWNNLPQLVRCQIIAHMDLPSKAKMSRCSKMCYAEIITSQNYIKSIKFVECYMESYDIYFQFYDDVREFHMEYFFEEYEEEGSQSIAFRIDRQLKREWEIEKSDIFMQPVQLFQNLINNSRDLKHIEIVFHKNVLDFKNMEKQRNLETLRIYDLRAIRRKLQSFENFELLSKLRKNIIFPVYSISLDQLLQIKARKSRLYDIKTTSKLLIDYIKAVADGKLDENVKKMRLVYHKNQERWDPESIFNLNVDFLNRGRDPHWPKAIWFDLKIEGKTRYAKFRITEKSFLMVIRLEEKREVYRQRAIEYLGREVDDELFWDSDTSISEHDWLTGIGFVSDSDI